MFLLNCYKNGFMCGYAGDTRPYNTHEEAQTAMNKAYAEVISKHICGTVKQLHSYEYNIVAVETKQTADSAEIRIEYANGFDDTRQEDIFKWTVNEFTGK